MTIKSQKLVKGLLSIGETGTLTEWGGQVRAVSLAAEYDKEDDIVVLSGEKEAGDETKTETLSGTVLDDYSAAGSIFKFSKEHEGEELPFIWEPNTEAGLRITGVLKMRQISIGGDVDTKNENDFEFPIIGDTDAGAVA